MGESLNVIALISGGKDSFYSILHCLQNGHHIIALGNLHPRTPQPNSSSPHDEEVDLNSFMYQTVGHTVIPLYAEAFALPLYRQEIIGTAVQTGSSYSDAELTATGKEEDETESLVPLLKRIIAEHPEANALSTGAILSTYQRTRVESVAMRLGLTPLAFLWQYPVISPESQVSLLRDMQNVELEARIVKVASGGLDEGFLWENVASQKGMARVERAMKRFGVEGDGAVIGEGGEFETLVVDGPTELFKKRIEIREEERRIVREGGGAAWLQILGARVVEKENVEHESEHMYCRVPDMLDERSEAILTRLEGELASIEPSTAPNTNPGSTFPVPWIPNQKIDDSENGNILHWTVSAEIEALRLSIPEEAQSAISVIRSRLARSSLATTDIVSTVIILRSMSDFATVNKIYATLFPHPSPPSRITISSGSLLPTPLKLLIHLTIHRPLPSSPARKALHVQSRSYWAPANIGPYSQASSLPSLKNTHMLTIAGQIPLVPHTMDLPSPGFPFSVVLSLQHLLRIARATNVRWFASACVYVPASSSSPRYSPSLPTRARLAYLAWKSVHTSSISNSEEEDEEVRDLWDDKFRYGETNTSAAEAKNVYPDHSILATEEAHTVPPFWMAEVEELPRGAEAEWHAGAGICDGPVSLTNTGFPSSSSRGTKHILTTEATEYQTITIEYPCTKAEFQALVTQLGSIHLLYVHMGMEGVGEMLGGIRGRGVVPCKSLWDGEGKKLGVVGVGWRGRERCLSEDEDRE